eukprot:UN27174
MCFKMPRICFLCDTIKISKSPLNFNQNLVEFDGSLIFKEIHLKIPFDFHSNLNFGLF